MKYIHKVKREYTADFIGDDMYALRQNKEHLAYIPSSIIENSNDWELQIEKDYEILSFITLVGGDKGAIFKKSHTEKFVHHKGWASSTEQNILLQPEIFGIHSVKRISDGEVFVVGEVYTKGGNDIEIGSFRISTDRITVVSKYGGWFTLDSLSKKKKPIFTTEDGVEYLKGEHELKDYFIEEDGVVVRTCWESWTNDSAKRFSTKEAAQEYLDKEKKEKVIKGLMEKHTVSNEPEHSWIKWEYLISELYDTLTKR